MRGSWKAEMSVSARSVSDRIRTVLMGFVSSITADSVLKSALRRTGRSPDDLERTGVDDVVIAELNRGLAFFLGTDTERHDSLNKLAALARSGPALRLPPPVAVEIAEETSVVDARTQARAFARELGFDRTHQARIATAVSELARNIYAYAGSGRVTLSAISTPRVGVKIVATDEGPGIPNLSEILGGDYRSRTGMGLGILACKRLMDEFSIVANPGRGTSVTITKYIP